MNLTVEELMYLINILNKYDDEIGTDILSKCVVEYLRITVNKEVN